MGGIGKNVSPLEAKYLAFQSNEFVWRAHEALKALNACEGGIEPWAASVRTSLQSRLHIWHSKEKQSCGLLHHTNEVVWRAHTALKAMNVYGGGGSHLGRHRRERLSTRSYVSGIPKIGIPVSCAQNNECVWRAHRAINGVHRTLGGIGENVSPIGAAGGAPNTLRVWGLGIRG